MSNNRKKTILVIFSVFLSAIGLFLLESMKTEPDYYKALEHSYHLITGSIVTVIFMRILGAGYNKNNGG